MHITSVEYTNDLFNMINQSAIKYCVLRNFIHLPESTGNSDLDILIHYESIHDFDQLIKQFIYQFKLKLVSVIEDGQYSKYCISDNNWGIQIDVFKGAVYFGNKEIIPSSILFANTEIYNNVYVLNDRVAALLSFLKELLNNKDCEQKYIIDLQTKFDSLDVKAVFLSQFSPHFISYLNLNLHKLKKESLIQLYQISKKSFKKPKLFKINFKIRRLFRQPGFFIAFLGSDGSGKSTIIENISPILSKAFHNAVYYEHMRPNKLPSIARLFGKKEEFNKLVTNPHGSSSSGFLGSLLRWLYYTFDYTFGFYSKVWPKKAICSCVWIFDRYYYDFLIDSKRGRIKLPRWLLKLGEFFVPEPDLILCLGTDAQTIYKRKPELSLDEVERQVLGLKKFCDSNRRAVWIDTGKDIDISSYDALDVIITMMSKRFGSLNNSK